MRRYQGGEGGVREWGGEGKGVALAKLSDGSRGGWIGSRGGFFYARFWTVSVLRHFEMRLDKKS